MAITQWTGLIWGFFWARGMAARMRGSARRDLNHDGLVDGADLGILLGGWDGNGTYPRECDEEEEFMESEGKTLSEVADKQAFESVEELLNFLGSCVKEAIQGFVELWYF